MHGDETDIKKVLRQRIAELEYAHIRLAGHEDSVRDNDEVVDKAKTLSYDTNTSSKVYSDQSNQIEAQLFKKIVRIASLREHSCKGLTERLVREGNDPTVVDHVIKRACELDIISDNRFAEVLVRSRLSQGWGIQGISAELARCGIDASAVSCWQQDVSIGYESEVDRALSLLNRKPPRAKNLRAAAYRLLVRKGYGADIASSAARKWFEMHEYGC